MKPTTVRAGLRMERRSRSLVWLSERDHPKIWLAPAKGGAASVLAANGLDLIPGGLEWSDDGKSLYFESGVKGETHLFRVDLATKSALQVTSGPRALRNGGLPLDDKKHGLYGQRFQAS